MCPYLVGPEALLEGLPDLGLVAVGGRAVDVPIAHAEGVLHCLLHLQTETHRPAGTEKGRGTGEKLKNAKRLREEHPQKNTNLHKVMRLKQEDLESVALSWHTGPAFKNAPDRINPYSSP